MSFKKIYVTADHKVFRDEDAEVYLKKKNDSKYLTKDGIIKIPKKRWNEAQEYEEYFWFKKALHASDDRNNTHRERFDDYRTIPKGSYNAIELGCGAFTNVRLMQGIESVALLDPLINKYLEHPNCTYKDGKMKGKKVDIIHSTIEDFTPKRKYNMVVLINVLEHCFDIPKVFEVVLSCLDKRGIFITSEATTTKEHIKHIANNCMDSGHPIRVRDTYYRNFVESNFDIVYKKEFDGLYENPYRKDFYYIGAKK